MLPILPFHEEHPLPYYVSYEDKLKALKEVPWMTNEKADAKTWLQNVQSNKQLQADLLNELITDVISQEIVSIASVSVSQMEEPQDQDVSDIVEEDLILPEVNQIANVLAWELLFSKARKAKEFETLKERQEELGIDSNALKALVVLNAEDFSKEGEARKKLLAEIPWDVLVFNYHSHLKDNSAARNVAFHILQEHFILQAASAEILDKCLLQGLEDDMAETDEREKQENPPRRI